jgi:hypothetical protein
MNIGVIFQPVDFPKWEKKKKRRSSPRKRSRIEFLKEKAQTKDGVPAELMAEPIALKKVLGNSNRDGLLPLADNADLTQRQSQAYIQRSESPRFPEESLHLGMRAAVDQVL